VASNRNLMKQPKGTLPKLPKASTSQAFASQSPAPAGVTAYPRSPKLEDGGDASVSTSDDADAMLQSKKQQGRRFGIHAPYSNNPRPKGI
jgi:hypothetical protein